MPFDLTRQSPVLTEAERIMTICNACRYCEGICAVFPAMERRRLFNPSDLEFLANLCHNCGACLYDCQYAPPHQFDVGVPSTLAQLRAETWSQYAWPSKLGGAFGANWLVTGVLVLASVAVVLVAALTTGGSLEPASGPGSFYSVIPHATTVALFLAAFGFAGFSMAMAIRNYWKAIGGTRPSVATLAQAFKSANTLEYLDGGGVGCMNEDDTPNDTRRVYHHLTYYGFTLCLLATILAGGLETGFDSIAPYPLWHPVVVCGTLGGAGLVIGPLGLLTAKMRRDPQLSDMRSRQLELTFLGFLVAMGLTGLATLFLRSTPAMPALLIVHLGVVLAFAVSMPYSKFVHGAYRFAALVHDYRERQQAGQQV